MIADRLCPHASDPGERLVGWGSTLAPLASTSFRRANRRRSVGAAAPLQEVF